MNIVTQYNTKRKINKIANNLLNININYIIININYIILSLCKYSVNCYNDVLKIIYMKVFTKYLFNNISNNRSTEECLVCYDTKNAKYKMPCCDKQYLCLNCFEQMYNLQRFNCLFCRKPLYKDDIIEVIKLISIHPMFKINNICMYFYKYGYINHIKNIKKIDNNNFFIKLNNKSNLYIINYNNGDIYWSKSYKNSIELTMFSTI